MHAQPADLLTPQLRVAAARCSFAALLIDFSVKACAFFFFFFLNVSVTEIEDLVLLLISDPTGCKIILMY